MGKGWLGALEQPDVQVEVAAAALALGAALITLAVALQLRSDVGQVESLLHRIPGF